jgi:uncharacterized protein (TIRG00374 family)
MAEQRNGALQEPPPNAPKLWGWHTYLSLAIALAILSAVALRIDLKVVWAHVAACNKGYLLVGALAHYATYPVRGRRWRRCLIHLPLQASKNKFSLLVFFYNFVDNVVPAKLGDVYGAHLARINAGVTRSAAMGSIVFLRTVDAWIVLILAALSSWFLFAAKLPPAIFWSLMGGVFIAVVATSIMLFFFLLKKKLPAWVPEKIQSMIQAFHTGMWPRSREIAPIALQSLVIWLLEVMWFYFIALAFDRHLSPSQTIFLTMIPLLATAFPFTPAGVGVVDVTLLGCLMAVGIPESMAGSLMVVNRFIDYWLHIGLGILIWSTRHLYGLRTWREVPLTADPAPGPKQASPTREVVYES